VTETAFPIHKTAKKPSAISWQMNRASYRQFVYSYIRPCQVSGHRPARSSGNNFASIGWPKSGDRWMWFATFFLTIVIYELWPSGSESVWN
jgi:hypothetical protein